MMFFAREFERLSQRIRVDRLFVEEKLSEKHLRHDTMNIGAIERPVEIGSVEAMPGASEPQEESQTDRLVREVFEFPKGLQEAVLEIQSKGFISTA